MRNIISKAIRAIPSALLVTASAGFGAYYAWTTGIEHGPVLGSLAVALGLGAVTTAVCRVGVRHTLPASAVVRESDPASGRLPGGGRLAVRSRSARFSGRNGR